jgi:hypothetical protein
MLLFCEINVCVTVDGDLLLLASIRAKVANDQVVVAPDSQHVAEVDGGAGGYESDNDDSGLMP